MDFKKTFDTFVGMVKLEPKAYKAAAKNDLKGSALNFALAAIAISLGGFWLTFDVLGLVGGAIALWIVYFIAVAIGVFIVWLFAKFLGGKASYSTHYNGGSYLVLWAVPMVVPIIGQIISFVGGLWAIVMHVFLIKEVHKLSTGKAVAAVLIPYALISFVILFFIGVGLTALIAAGGLDAFVQ